MLAGAALHGWRCGAVDQFLSLLALVGAISLSGYVLPYVVGCMGVGVGFWPQLLAFLVTWVGLGMLRKLLVPILSVSLGLLDKVGGLLLSLCVTLLLLSVLLQGWCLLSSMYGLPELPSGFLLRDLLLDFGQTFCPDQLFLHRGETAPDPIP